jgi:multiple sugar transport system substrate-binding protein
MKYHAWRFWGWQLTRWLSRVNWQRSLLLLLCVGLISWGCRSGQPPGMARQTIKLSGWGASPVESRLLRQVLQQFEATHPQIRVRFEVINSQYMDVIKTRLIGDAGPDVFYLDALEAPFLMEQGVLEPLNRYITPQFDLADFEPKLLQAFQQADRLYGLPKDYSTLALFYNKTAFAKAGITQPPRNWEELKSISKRLTIDSNGDGKPEQYGLGIAPELARLVYLMQAYGGQVTDAQGQATFASESALQGLNLVIQQYRGDRSAIQPSEVGSASGTELFGRGKAVMVIEGNWAIPYLQETFPQLDFATSELPQINQKPGTMAYTVAYVMNTQSKHKQAAWELIAYLTGKEGMKTWTSKGFALPTRRSVAAALRYDQDTLRSALVRGVEYATPWQLGKFPAIIMNQFNNQFSSVLLGQQPLQKAMQQAEKSANQQIERDR